MRKSLFVIVAYVALALQTGLAGLLAWRSSGVSPSFILILAVFIGLYASPLTAAWAMLVLGFLADLTQIYPVADGTVVTFIGPSALGYLFGAFAIIQLRTMMYRDSTVALTAMVFFVGVFIHLAVVALLSLRGLPGLPSEPVHNWSATGELVHRFKELVYTTLVALPLGFVLVRTVRIWAFEPIKGKTHRGW